MIVLRVLLCALVLLAVPAVAQVPLGTDPVVGATVQIGQVERDLESVDRKLDTRVDLDEQKRLRGSALAAQQVARAAIVRLEDQMALVEARVAELGPPPAGGEAPELRAQRSSLAGRRSTIDAAVRRGRLADVEAQQLVDEIARGQAEQFSQTISARVASPVTPAFWHALYVSLPRDLRRVVLFVGQGGTYLRARLADGLPWQAPFGFALALIVLFPLRVLARRAGQVYLIEGAPGHRLRRSANGIWRVTVGTLAPLLAAVAAVQGLRWAGLLPESYNGLLDAVVVAMGFGGFTTAVTGAVLMRTQPSWRIAPIDDEIAGRLRPLSWVLAGLAGGSILIEAFNAAIGASRAALIATEAVIALLHLLLVGALLVILGRLRAARAARDDAASLSTSAGLGAATLLLWLLVIAALVALLIGYIGFSLFVAQFIAWATVLGCAVYVLWVAADDVATTVFTRASRVGVTFTRAFGVRGSVVEQFGLLLSVGLRLMLVVVAIGLLLSPFGTGGGLGSIFGRVGALAQGVTVAGVSISPGTILRGVIVLFVGLGITRAFMAWLEGRYLPATDLDRSGRNSVSLVARYIGIAIATIWALASLGIGVERIALLLSALSVGIGFGLQAITQNFVSGLILLAERPIKIGDLVRIGNDEGDVKRISVRSTEIELGDHSTLIVPNSELITKPVLNKTLATPLGRIQIQFSVPIETDVEQVRGIVLAAFAAESAVIEEPRPVAFIDSLLDGRVLFNCMAHVASPRSAYPARSNVLSAILAAFREHQIGVGTVPQRLEIVAGDLPTRDPALRT